MLKQHQIVHNYAEAALHVPHCLFAFDWWACKNVSSLITHRLGSLTCSGAIFKSSVETLMVL